MFVRPPPRTTFNSFHHASHGKPVPRRVTFCLISLYHERRRRKRSAKDQGLSFYPHRGTNAIVRKAIARMIPVQVDLVIATVPVEKRDKAGRDCRQAWQVCRGHPRVRPAVRQVPKRTRSSEHEHPHDQGHPEAQCLWPVGEHSPVGPWPRPASYRPQPRGHRHPRQPWHGEDGRASARRRAGLKPKPQEYVP